MGGFTAAQIVNDKVPVSIVGSLANIPIVEQEAYNMVFVPFKPLSYYQTGFSETFNSRASDVPRYLSGTAMGGIIQIPFRGKRIGVVVGKASSNGVLSFDVDGTSYGTLDTSDGGLSGSFNNVPYLITEELIDGNHLLTITKVDTKTTMVHGILVDSASAAQTFQKIAFDYYQTYDDGRGGPFNIGNTDTTIISTANLWAAMLTITNTTGATINVTLKNGGGTVVVGPFPVPANDVRQIQGPLYFSGGMKAVGSATGCFISLGVHA